MPVGVYEHKHMQGKNNYFFGKHLTPWNKGIKGIFVGKKAGHWKGGKTISRGYILIYSPNHPFTNKDKSVMEHRLVVEKHIGRYLTPKEKVHHINRIKTDNRPQNLMAFVNHSAHRKFEMGKKINPKEIIFHSSLGCCSR